MSKQTIPEDVLLLALNEGQKQEVKFDKENPEGGPCVMSFVFGDGWTAGYCYANDTSIITDEIRKKENEQCDDYEHKYEEEFQHWSFASWFTQGWVKGYCDAKDISLDDISFPEWPETSNSLFANFDCRREDIQAFFNIHHDAKFFDGIHESREYKLYNFLAHIQPKQEEGVKNGDV